MPYLHYESPGPARIVEERIRESIAGHALASLELSLADGGDPIQREARFLPPSLRPDGTIKFFGMTIDNAGLTVGIPQDRDAKAEVYMVDTISPVSLDTED